MSVHYYCDGCDTRLQTREHVVTINDDCDGIHSELGPFDLCPRCFDKLHPQSWPRPPRIKHD